MFFFYIRSQIQLSGVCGRNYKYIMVLQRTDVNSWWWWIFKRFFFNLCYYPKMSMVFINLIHRQMKYSFNIIIRKNTDLIFENRSQIKYFYKWKKKSILLIILHCKCMPKCKLTSPISGNFPQFHDTYYPAFQPYNVYVMCMCLINPFMY